MTEENVEDAGNGDKLLKVRVPVEVHVRLHRAKIISGRFIQDMVEDAVCNYLDEFEREAAAKLGADALFGPVNEG